MTHFGSYGQPGWTSATPYSYLSQTRFSADGSDGVISLKLDLDGAIHEDDTPTVSLASPDSFGSISLVVSSATVDSFQLNHFPPLPDLSVNSFFNPQIFLSDTFQSYSLVAADITSSGESVRIEEKDNPSPTTAKNRSHLRLVSNNSAPIPNGHDASFANTEVDPEAMMEKIKSFFSKPFSSPEGFKKMIAEVFGSDSTESRSISNVNTQDQDAFFRAVLEYLFHPLHFTRRALPILEQLPKFRPQHIGEIAALRFSGLAKKITSSQHKTTADRLQGCMNEIARLHFTPGQITVLVEALERYDSSDQANLAKSFELHKLQDSVLDDKTDREKFELLLAMHEERLRMEQTALPITRQSIRARHFALAEALIFRDLQVRGPLYKLHLANNRAGQIDVEMALGTIALSLQNNLNVAEVLEQNYITSETAQIILDEYARRASLGYGYVGYLSPQELKKRLETVKKLVDSASSAEGE